EDLRVAGVLRETLEVRTFDLALHHVSQSGLGNIDLLPRSPRVLGAPPARAVVGIDSLRRLAIEQHAVDLRGLSRREPSLDRAPRARPILPIEADAQLCEERSGGSSRG